jgi:hypothetical protein
MKEFNTLAVSVAELRHEIRKRFPCMRTQKIDAIRWLREQTNDKHLLLNYMESLGYYTVYPQSWVTIVRMLNLCSAKRFVEEC